MDDFFKLLSLMISVAGFVIVTGFLLWKGEDLLVAVLKGIVAFFVLKVAQGMFSSISKFAAEQTKKDTESEP
jgi:uncharacterized membrane protein YedE/YeeE